MKGNQIQLCSSEVDKGKSGILIFGEGKYVFAEDMKQGEGKGRKYLKKESIFLQSRKN